MIFNKATWDDWIKTRYSDSSFDSILSKKVEMEDIGLIKSLAKLKKKSKYYTFLIYPDNKTNMKFKEFLELSGQYDFAYIYHESPDNDINGFPLATTDSYDFGFLESSLTKPHYHVIVEYGYSKEWASVVKDLYRWGITYCEPVKSPDDLLIYFTHRDMKSLTLNKERYNFDDIVYTGNFIDRVARLIKRQDNKNLITPSMDLLDFAYACESKYEFYAYAMSQPMLRGELKSMQLIFKSILDERFKR